MKAIGGRIKGVKTSTAIHSAAIMPNLLLVLLMYPSNCKKQPKRRVILEKQGTFSKGFCTRTLPIFSPTL